MADNLIFPIGFDLEKAVNEAGQQWDKKYAKKLEDYINKRPIKVKLDFENLTDVKTRLAQLKIEPITPETKAAIKELARELQVLAKALEQVQKYSSRSAGTAEVRGARVDEIEAKAAAARELARQRAVKAEQAEVKLAEARERSANAANKAATGVRNLTNAYKEQSTYLDRLIKRMVTYWSVQQVSTFLTNIREVTAQFELQRVSLGAIIQDQARANQLFSEIKTFALKSPISIMDLTKYTKQVAAYGIETEKLFDTTKMLADISVGLGVDMSRLTLFLGQVYATGHLRASEVRQATEAGIPLVDKLAQKLSETNGKLVSAAEVMDLISKRAISFEMVEEVFKDMTSAGGMFYQMQEKQGNTLFGMWAKLGDAASVMYEQIGNTEPINEGMKAAIEALTELMRNWKSSAAQMGVIVGALGLKKLAGVIKGWQSTIVNERLAANARLTTAQNAYNSALAAEAAAIKANTDATNHNANAKAAQATATRISAKASLEAAFAESRAAAATTLWSKAWNKLKAAFMGNWVTLLLTAIAALVTHFLMAEDAAARLKNTLADIGAESERETSEAVGKFKILADRAIAAANGSKAQRDALEELKNTYGNIIPYEYLTLENLRKMKGEYGELTTMIEEYNAKLKLTNSQNAIEEEYAAKEKERRTKLRKKLTEEGLENSNTRGTVWEIKFNPTTIQSFFKNLDEISKSVTDKTEAVRQAVKSIWGELGIEDRYFNQVVEAMINFDRHAFEGQGTMMDYAEALIQKNQLLQQEQENYDKASKALNEYTAIVDNLKKSIEDRGKESFSDDDSYTKYLENEKLKIQDVYGAIVEVMNHENDEVITAYNGLIAQLNDGTITYTNLLAQLLELPLSAKGHLAVTQIQEVYAQLAPTDETVIVARNKFAELANSMEVSMFAIQRSQMKQGESLKTHRKTIVSEIDTINEKILELIYRKTQLAAQGYSTDAVEKELVQQQKFLEFYNAYLATLPTYDKEKNKGGRTSDPRLQTLQEIANKMAEVNKEYDELLKKEGQTKALADTQKLFASSFKQMQATADKYGFKLPAFEVPQTIEDVQKWYKAIMDNIKRLNLKNADKVLIELGFKSDKAAIDKQQKDIEAKLKRLADRISRTKTAKEFYEKILSQTGDYDLAAKVSLSIYGDTGYDLQKQLAEQIRTYFDNENVKVEIPVDVITADNQINYKRLGEFAEQMKETLGEEPYKAIKKIAEEGQKDLAKTYEGYLKDLEKAKTYADKRVELARTTAAKIREIERNPQYTKEQKAELKRGYQEREDREAAKLEYEAFKDTPLYVQMFEDLEHASTSTLEMMKSRLEALSGVWGTALDPTQLKEIQSRMNEIDTQLRERNPFKTLKESYQQYRDAVKSVSLQGAVENAGAAAKELYGRTVDYGADSAQARAAEKELKAREKIVEIARQINAENKKGQKALDAAAQKANDNLKIKRGELEIAAAEEQALRDKSTYENPDQDPKVIAAHEAVEAAKEEVNLAERVAEITTNNAKTSKTLKENFASAANQVTQYMGMAGDLAHAVADTMEALGGDEDDVQFWNDIGDAIGDLTAGFQGIVDSILSLNVAGIISNAIGVIPNMVKGFVGLFSAGKVRKANKEIKRQAELLEQLEYTYGRLQNAADKLFGRDYVNNYNQQLKNLQAQQSAYLKQAQAERSKGKKADEDKIKEYENQARDTANAIKEMQDDLVAHFTGSSRTDVARQMAQSWIDARASMSDTFAAIKEDYAEMIKNMIVEGAAARVIENALSPVWDSMEKMLAKNDVEGAIDSLVNGMDSALNAANNGMEVLWKALEARGYDMKQLIGDVDSEYTGIAKNIAGATSEEINAVAAIGNTLMYYNSHLPIISQNVAAIYELMSQGKSSTISAASTGWTDWQQQAMDNYNAIARNTADTVVRCERAAVACEAMAEKMGRIIVAKGGKFAVNTTYV